jgi:prepilin-type N-terminal cleavage/methylation domain-containing protein
MKPKKSEQGFSLIEVTVALGVMTVIVGIVFTLFNRVQQNYRYEEAYADAARNGRFAVSRLEEIIRSAGTNPTGRTSVNWLTFVDFGGGDSSSSLHLKSDLNGDGATTSTLTSDADVIVASEDVVLRLNSTANTIEMVDNNPPNAPQHPAVPIAENIQSLTFSDPDTVNHSRKEVDITLTAIPAGIATSDTLFRQVTFTANIRLRNRLN